MATLNAATNKPFMAAILLLLGLLMSHPGMTGAQSIGVCYGRNGGNLPLRPEVVSLYKTNGISRMRIYDPEPATLQALRGSNIEIILDVPKTDLETVSDPIKARNWVNINLGAYAPAVNFRYIAVGNEIKPNEPEAKFVLPAMQNIYNAIVSANLQGQIKVSTAIEPSLLGIPSSPPSTGFFSDNARPYINPIIKFLAKTGSPLLANIYPYFSYTGDPNHISLPSALFTAPGVVVQDGKNGYRNQFDALLDALYSALEKEGAPNMKIVVSETGWPSEGGQAATASNAGTYYNNLIKHVKGGTLKRPAQAIETYLFAMFDENQKDPGVEQHFGLFLPNKQPKYQISFR